MGHYDMKEDMESICNILNYIFMFVFTTEAVIKIYALRFEYFYDGWNLFDFTVVLMTIIILILTFIGLAEDLASVGMVLRTLRIGRMLRLIKRAQTL